MMIKSSPKTTLRKSKISFQSSNIALNNQHFYDEDKFLSNMATIDSDTNNLITKKLNGVKDSDNSSMRKLRPKRFNM